MGIITNREKTVAVLRSLETGDPKAFAYLDSETYIQHNLAVGDGVAGIAAVAGSQPLGSFKVRVVRAFQDGDYGFAHTEYDFFGPKVGIDVFRFEEGLIVEHWDNLRELLPPNRSGRTQLDGPTLVVDLDRTAENKALVEAFVTENWLQGLNTYDRYIKDDVYLQHNPAGEDGLASFRATLGYFRQNGISMHFTKLHKVLGEGNFVLTLAEGVFGPGGGQPTSFYDLFRLENGCIVEHWDIIEPILPRSEWMNQNGKF